MTNAYSHLGQLDEALVTGARALDIARRLGDAPLRIFTTTYLEQAHYFRGEYERVIELATDNLASLPPDPLDETFGAALPICIYGRFRLFQSLTHLGRFAEAAVYAAEARRLAEERHHAYTIGMVNVAASYFHAQIGDWAKARSLIEHAINAWRSENILHGAAEAVALSALLLAQVGEAGAALARLREGEQLLERDGAMGYFIIHRHVYRSLSRTCLLLGRLDEAQTLGDRALEYAPPQTASSAYSFHLLGDIATHPDRFDPERGEAHYRQALTLAEPRGMRPLIARCHLGLGSLYRRTGKADQAHEHLTTAAAMCRDMGMAYWLEKAEAELQTA
jgi:tetratricopeptide (TPR) repeat protein